MQARVVARTSIKASPSEVFDYLRDLNTHFLWNPPLISIKPITKLQLGSEYKSSSMILGVKVSGVNKVCKFLEDKELELENNTGILKYRVNYRLSTKEGKTQLVCTTEVSSDSNAFAFAKPVLKLLARRELQTDLKALTIAVENQLKP